MMEILRRNSPKESIKGALESFINNLQNNYGPIGDGMFDITTISHNCFMDFVWDRFDITKPIAYDENKAITSWERNPEHILEAWQSMSEKVANDLLWTRMRRR